MIRTKQNIARTQFYRDAVTPIGGGLIGIALCGLLCQDVGQKAVEEAPTSRCRSYRRNEHQRKVIADATCIRVTARSCESHAPVQRFTWIAAASACWHCAELESQDCRSNKSKRINRRSELPDGASEVGKTLSSQRAIWTSTKALYSRQPL